MSFVIYTNALSLHQLPLAKEIVNRIGEDNFRYVYTSLNGQKFQQSEEKLPWAIYEGDNREEASRWVEGADVVLVGGIRPIDLMERRLKDGKTTLYMSERWFKPIPILGAKWLAPGWIRMFVPSYWKMAKRFANLFKYDKYRFLPIGPWSKKDMGLMCKVFGVKMPEENVTPWGYCVEAGHPELRKGKNSEEPLKVLWVGRMLKLKRVDTIIRAVGLIQCSNKSSSSGSHGGYAASLRSLFCFDHFIRQPEPRVTRPNCGIKLTLVGDGPERERLMKLAERVNSTARLRASTSPIITFLPSQPMAKIREIMREHDVYVFSSNGMDGWGAVVSEAMEEGMKVLGTCETGAAATMLPKSNLFHCGDYKTLADKLKEEIPTVEIKNWSAANMAKELVAL